VARAQGHDGEWLTELDRYYTQHLPARLDGQWLGPASQCDGIRRIQQRLRSLLEPLAGDARYPREWADALSQLLLAVYQRDAWDLDDPAQRQVVLACEQLHHGLAGLADVPDPIAPRMTAAASIQLALQTLETASIASAINAEAVELLGWLELPLDDAPALVVTSFHEGIVPKSVNADLFSARSRLGLDDNARRYGMLQSGVLLASARVTLIVARRDQERSVLLPIVVAADEQTVASGPVGVRPARESQRRPPPARPSAIRPVPDAAAAAVAGARRRQAHAISRLACPYRFYLQHVLRLAAVSDQARELDGAAFGSLLHEVLRDFGESPEAQSSDPSQIAGRLDMLLDQHARESFGALPVAAVLVQLEQLRLRLRAFAEKQAQWYARGWRIAHTEAPGRQLGVDLMADGKAPLLTGRMDRIDVHEQTANASS
jgi:hypothetical protein